MRDARRNENHELPHMVNAADAHPALQLLQCTTSRHRKFISFLQSSQRSAMIGTVQGGLCVMGIESLNSAVAAAGFAMVSDESMDENSEITGMAFATPSVGLQPAGPASRALALIEAPARAPASAVQALGEKVTGLLESWRPRG
jgi:hypothetical protein